MPTSPPGSCWSTRPAGLTSHDVVARARRVLSVRKVGHAGTLDPMATGSPRPGRGRGHPAAGLRPRAGQDLRGHRPARAGDGHRRPGGRGAGHHAGRAPDDDAVRAALAAQSGRCAGALGGQRGEGRRPAVLRPRAAPASRWSWRRGRSPCTPRGAPVGRPTPDLVDVDVTVGCTRRHLHPGHRPGRRRRARRRRAPHRVAPHRLGPFAVRAAPVEEAAAALAAGGGPGVLGLTDAATAVFPRAGAHRGGGDGARVRPAGAGVRHPGHCRRRRPGRPAGRPGGGRRRTARVTVGFPPAAVARSEP